MFSLAILTVALYFVGLGYYRFMPIVTAQKKVEGPRDDLIWLAYSEKNQLRSSCGTWLAHYVPANTIRAVRELNPECTDGQPPVGSYVRYWAFTRIVQEPPLMPACPPRPGHEVSVNVISACTKVPSKLTESTDLRWYWPFEGVTPHGVNYDCCNRNATLRGITRVLAPFDGDVSIITLPSYAQAVRIRSRDGTVEIVVYDPGDLCVEEQKFVKREDGVMHTRDGCITFKVLHCGVPVRDPVEFVLRKCGLQIGV